MTKHSSGHPPTRKKPDTLKSNTLILRTAALVLLPLQLLFSIFLLLRGHDEPGGGFIAGLVASGAFSLYLFAYGKRATREILHLEPRDFLAFGLLLGTGAASLSLLLDEALMQSRSWTLRLGVAVEFKLSTVLLFDIGVYFAVLGTLLTIVFALMETEDQVEA